MKTLLISAVIIFAMIGTTANAGQVVIGGSQSSDDNRGLFGYSFTAGTKHLAPQLIVEANDHYAIGQALVQLYPIKGAFEFGFVWGVGAVRTPVSSGVDWDIAAIGGVTGGISLARSCTIFATERYVGTTTSERLRYWTTDVGFRLGI